MFNWVCWIAPDNTVSRSHPDALTTLTWRQIVNQIFGLGSSSLCMDGRSSHSVFLVSAVVLAFRYSPLIGMRLLISVVRKYIITKPHWNVDQLPRLVTPCMHPSFNLPLPNPPTQGGRRQTLQRVLSYFFVSIIRAATKILNNHFIGIFVPIIYVRAS